MFAWAPIPPRFAGLGSVEFSKLLLARAKVAVVAGPRLRRAWRGVRAHRPGGEHASAAPGGPQHPRVPAERERTRPCWRDCRALESGRAACGTPPRSCCSSAARLPPTNWSRVNGQSAGQARGGNTIVIGWLNCSSASTIEPAEIDPLPHGWRKPTAGHPLKRHDFTSPMSHRRAVRPAVDFQQVDHHVMEIALHGVEFRQAHVLDLLDDVLPVHVVHPLAAREAAQQAGLVFRPGESVAVVEIVRHCKMVSDAGCAAPLGSVAAHDRLTAAFRSRRRAGLLLSSCAG